MTTPRALPARTAASRRLAAVIGPALIGALFLTSCGGDDGAATQSTIDLSASSTAFVVRPPATTIPPEDTGVPGTGEGGVVEGTQEYEVQSGDYPLGVAERFGVTLDALLGVNEWSSASEFPFPGNVILIPPGGRPVAEVLAGGSTDDTADDAAAGGGATTTGTDATEPAATIPDAGDNCAAGSYTIVAGDYPGKVAKSFDVTVEALNAANAGTAGYGAFYEGLEIVIPAKSDC